MFSFTNSIPIGHFVETVEEATEWLAYFLKSYKQNNGLGLDTETTGLNVITDRVVAWSLSDGVERICLLAELIPVFKEALLENKDIDFDLTNAKFDAHMLFNSGADISKAGNWRDTLVQSFLLNENNTGRHGLKECITDHFGRITPTFEQTFGKVPNKVLDKVTGKVISKQVGDIVRDGFSDPSKKIVAADYASLDAYNTTKLRAYFDDRLNETQTIDDSTLKDYFYTIEVPFTKVLWKMERLGITLDKGHLESQKEPIENRMSEIEREFNHECLEGLNLNSPKLVAKFFYEKIKKPIVKYTKGGASGIKSPSVDHEVLDGWAGEGDPWAQKLLEYRELATVYRHYIIGLPKWQDQNCRVHTNFKQIGAVTMRLSSTEPNLQNIKRVGEDVYKIRESFIPGESQILIIADYEQLEMRIMAHISGDQKMVEAINAGIDIHCLTVAEMYGIPYDEVMAAKKADKEIKSHKRTEPLSQREHELLFYRQAAKAAGFGILYGIGGAHLASNLTKELKRLVTEEEGISLIRKWFDVFSTVKNYIASTKSTIWQQGYVQTITGRYRRFGDLRGMSKRDSSQAERQAVNSIIQGTASDIAKKAMLLVDSNKRLQELGCKLLLQIHDELICECPDDKNILQEAKSIIKDLMEHPFDFDLAVAIPVEIGSGYSWATAK